MTYGKIISALVGAILLALGASLLADIAFGSGRFGWLVLIVVIIAAGYFFFKRSQTAGYRTTALWVSILRGLAFESILYPVANVVMTVTTISVRQHFWVVIVYSAVIGLLFTVVFVAVAHFLHARVKYH